MASLSSSPSSRVYHTKDDLLVLCLENDGVYHQAHRATRPIYTGYFVAVATLERYLAKKGLLGAQIQTVVEACTPHQVWMYTGTAQNHTGVIKYWDAAQQETLPARKVGDKIRDEFIAGLRKITRPPLPTHSGLAHVDECLGGLATLVSKFPRAVPLLQQAILEINSWCHTHFPNLVDHRKEFFPSSASAPGRAQLAHRGRPPKRKPHPSQEEEEEEHESDNKDEEDDPDATEDEVMVTTTTTTKEDVVMTRVSSMVGTVFDKLCPLEGPQRELAFTKDQLQQFCGTITSRVTKQVLCDHERRWTKRFKTIEDQAAQVRRLEGFEEIEQALAHGTGGGGGGNDGDDEDEGDKDSLMMLTTLATRVNTDQLMDCAESL